jgi:hypothetical protein
VIGATSTSPPPKRRRRLPVRPLPVRAEPPLRVDRGAVRTEAVAVFGEAGAVVVSGAIPQVSQ